MLTTTPMHIQTLCVLNHGWHILGGGPTTDFCLDFKLLPDVTNLQQMRIITTQLSVCLDQERQTRLQAYSYVLEYDGTIFKLEPHFDLQKSSDTPPVSIPFRQHLGSLLWIVRHTHTEIAQHVL